MNLLSYLFLSYFLYPMVGSGNDLGSIASSENIGVVTNIITAIWTWITSNALLTFFLFLGIIGAVIGIFRRLKRTAR